MTLGFEPIFVVLPFVCASTTFDFECTEPEDGEGERDGASDEDAGDASVVEQETFEFALALAFTKLASLLLSLFPLGFSSTLGSLTNEAAAVEPVIGIEGDKGKMLMLTVIIAAECLSMV